MSERSVKRSFVVRQTNPETWIRAANAQPASAADTSAYTARLTIDVTAEERGRIKIAAFQRGITVADMLRELFAREFPATSGDPS